MPLNERYKITITIIGAQMIMNTANEDIHEGNS